MKPSQNISKRQQKGRLSTREEKKRIAIRSNSGLFFQVGLIVSLILMLWIIQQDWKLMARPMVGPNHRPVLEDTPMVTYTIEKPPVEEIQTKTPPVKRKVVLQKPVGSLLAVKNSDNNKSNSISPTEPSDGPIPQGGYSAPTKPTAPTNVLQVEEVPVFPGCDRIRNKKERLACFQEKIQKFVGRKFRTDDFVDRYAGERKQIYVKFTIDESGEVTEIQAISRGADDLAQEAIRVIEGMPSMIPGKQNGEPVKVSYQLPIVLHLNN